MSKSEYQSHYRKNFNLAYPVMLSQLGHIMVAVADSMMVGQVGVEPLAAASLANVIFSLLMLFGIGVSYGITPLVAAADGRHDLKFSGVILKHGFIINLVTGVVLITIVTFGSDVLQHLDQPKEVVKLAVPYLELITFSLIPLMIFQTFRQFAEGLSLTKQAMFIIIGSNLINIGLNYILIFGKLGFPALGLMGAGWASLIARIIMALAMWSFIYFLPRFRSYWKDFSFSNYSWKILNRILGIGLPAGVQFIFEVSAFSFAAVMMGWLGARALAAHQIAINLAAITYMMATGLSAAGTIRVGNQLGKKDIAAMRHAAFSIFIMVIIFMSICAVLFILGRDFLPTLYIDSPEVIELASSLLVIAAFFQISDGVQVVGLGTLRGMADVKIPTLITFVAYWVLALPMGYLLGFKVNMGAIGIWYGLLTGLSVAAVLLAIRFTHLSKKMLPG